MNKVTVNFKAVSEADRRIARIHHNMKLQTLIIFVFTVLCTVHCAVIPEDADEQMEHQKCSKTCEDILPNSSSQYKSGHCTCTDSKSGYFIQSQQNYRLKGEKAASPHHIVRRGKLVAESMYSESLTRSRRPLGESSKSSPERKF